MSHSIDERAAARFLSVREVAGLLNLTTRTVYKCMSPRAKPRLRSIRVGGSRRIRADWLDAYLAECAEGEANA